MGIFVLPTEAGFLAGLDVDTIVSLVCSGELHIYKTEGRGTYICLTSLCLLRQSANHGDEETSFERTKLSTGLEEQELLIGDLRKL